MPHPKNYLSNEEIKTDIVGKFQPWWDSKTDEEKAWYIRFWARLKKL
jgi:hypothetical protein